MEPRITVTQLERYRLKNNLRTELSILNFGAAIYSLNLFDKNNVARNIVVAPKNLKTYVSEKYMNENPCFGASVGRYAGRISQGKFLLDGNLYTLYEKDGVHLHGGFRGFQSKIWKLEKKTQNSVELSYFSKDGEEGYPGNLEVSVTYVLSNSNEIHIQYSAKTDKKTPVNLTNHSYFNLNGEGNVSGHVLKVAANSMLETDAKLLPTGAILSLQGTEKDFSEPKKIGETQVDDTFVLKKTDSIKTFLYAPESGISLKMKSNQPAVVVYIPKALSFEWEYQTAISKTFPSICLEMQNFPDAPNHQNFPDSILHPGHTYYNEIVLGLEIDKN